MTTTMTGAELKTKLGAWGIPPSWFADRCNKTMRTVVRWFDGDDDLRPEVAEEAERIGNRTVDEMQRVLDSAEPDEDGVVTLRTYRTDEEFVNPLGYPASWHRQLIFRVMEHLEAQGHAVRVVYQ